MVCVYVVSGVHVSGVCGCVKVCMWCACMVCVCMLCVYTYVWWHMCGVGMYVCMNMIDTYQ